MIFAGEKSYWQPDWQTDEGAIKSIVCFADGRMIEDSNNFITALWQREVRSQRLAATEPSIRVASSNALKFLQAGGDQVHPGCWGFWSAHTRPDWANGVGADVDDTAIILTELLHSGAVSESAVQQIIYKIFSRVRVARNKYHGPGWIQPGCFSTWIPNRLSNSSNSNISGNVVDVTVNANALALLALVGAKTAPGYIASCVTVNEAVEWAGQDARRWQAIAPYYGNINEFVRAVEHAIDCGAAELTGAFERACQQLELQSNSSSAICRSAFGKTCWSSNALTAIRNPSEVTTGKTVCGEALCA